METTSSNNNLLIFQTITNFVSELSEMFGEDSHNLKLYNRLITKTTVSHTVAIKKHIEAFSKFCLENKDAILNKNYKAFKNPKVSYSEKVFINFDLIFGLADLDTKKVIWQHILTILAFVDPTTKAREILKKNTDSSKEANFLSDIIDKVEDQIDPNANPMEAVSSIMSSGIFTDLMSNMNNGLQDGSLDLGKLMGTVQTMVTSMGVDTSDPTNNPMNMINTMMSGMANANTSPDSIPKITEES